MRTRHTATLQKLRLAVDCLPRQTRAAMLQGIRSNPIIAGAYTSRDGICPMLAAHRSGGRTDCIAFAKAWDAFAFRGIRRRLVGRRRLGPRAATPRELLTLTAQLEASILDGSVSDLAAAIADHERLCARRESARPGDPDRARELRGRRGWSWLRVFRRYDEYERELAAIAEQAPERQPIL